MSKDYNLLNEINPEEYFRLVDGKVIKNLYELINSLRSMHDNTFRHHVNNEKNDFANWIRDVFKDYELAEDILKSKNKKEIIKRIEKRLFRNKRIRDNKIEEILKREKEIEKKTEKIEEILRREKEIEKREQKIEEIEAAIEKELAKQKEQQAKETEKFFTKEFIQGLIIGVLISLIIGLIYIKLL
jgi:predicted ribosome quality control (RQC) complex YloA/Tae2 family protein